MEYYYTAVESRSHAFLLERRMKLENVICELVYMPRVLMTSLCNMGVRFDKSEYRRAVDVIRRAGLPGCRLYRELVTADGYEYYEEQI